MHSKSEKFFLATVISSGMILLLLTTYFCPILDWKDFLFLSILGIITESQAVEFDDANGISITSAIIICAILLGNPAVVLWVSAVSVSLAIVKKHGGGFYSIFNIPYYATLFNLSLYVLTASANMAAYYLLGGTIIQKRYAAFSSTVHLISLNSVPLLISIFTGIFVNTVLVALLMAIRSHESILKIWSSKLLWSIVNLVIVGLIGVIITALYAAYDWFIVLLFFAPFTLARYVFAYYKDLQHSYLQTVKSLTAAIETKDEYTIGHSKRVEFYSGIIAKEMKLSARRCNSLRYAALLHDIGKIGIDEEILNKKEKLSDEDWKLIRNHPDKGAHIVEDIEFLSSSVDIIRSHHERFDGKGYPRGLSSNELPLEAMILAVADSYDAMTSDRPYRKALSQDTALVELQHGAGFQFSPEVVRSFDRAIHKKENQIHVA
ncbi:MAG TPA: HD-GYP domain-containing protein [Clostridia bacterium]|nr:HD-GYP domain-containing protein [Clostridia bacterium]